MHCKANGSEQNVMKTVKQCLRAHLSLQFSCFITIPFPKIFRCVEFCVCLNVSGMLDFFGTPLEMLVRMTIHVKHY